MPDWCPGPAGGAQAGADAAAPRPHRVARQRGSCMTYPAGRGTL